MKDILAYLQAHAQEILRDVERLVRIETPSRDLDAINRLQAVTGEWFAGLGKISRRSTDFGDIVQAQVKGSGSDHVVLLAHVDTVYPIGSWTELWRLDGDRAYGPGSYDMKAGIVQALWALRALQAVHKQPASNIDLLLTPDEEIGSDAARPLIEDLARAARAVLVLEPPFMNGDLKIARKGVGEYVVHVQGKAAHQGVEPEKGRNAIVAAAHFIEQLVPLQDLEKGTTLGPNVIQGGTASNVVADSATLQVDLRIWSLPEAARVDAALRSIRPLEGTRYEISGGLNRPPMEPSAGSFKLLERAQALAKEIGFSVGAARVGGGSDGNFTAQLAPTLDGFGAMGADAHQKDAEYIHIPSLPARTALLAGMLMES